MRTGSCTWPTVERTVWAELKRDYELVPLTLCVCVCVCPPITCTMCTAYTDKSCYNIFSMIVHLSMHYFMTIELHDYIIIKKLLHMTRGALIPFSLKLDLYCQLSVQ